MKKVYTLTIATILLFHISILAQVNFQANVVELKETEQVKLHDLFRDFKTVCLDTRTLSDFLRGKKSDINFNLRIGSHYQWKINLEENELRAPNYNISVNNVIVEQLVNTCITYKGLLNNDSSQPIRLSITDDQFEGYIIDNQEILFIRPLSKIIANYSDNQHFVIFRGRDVINRANIKECGNEDVDIINAAFEKTQSSSSARATTSCRVLEIATEADFEFFQLNGSNVASTNVNILNVLNQVEGIYQTTFNIRFLVPFQSVWTTTNDPYTSTSSATVIEELANYWQANRSTVARDVVYFFSGKTGHDVRGRARVFGAVCDNLANSYAFTAAALTNVNPVITTAHELGHLFNATHPNGSSESCSPTRTIMCVVTCSNPPCADNRVANFSMFSQNEINAWINGQNACLTDVLNVNIGGTNPVCSSGQFTVVGLPPNSSVTSWLSVNTSALTVTNGGVPTRQNNYTGFVNITANGNYGNDGCTFTSTKAVGVGNYFPIGTSSVNSNCSGNTFNVLNTSLSSACTANTPIYFTYKITDSNYSNFVFTPVSVPSGASWSSSGGYLYMTVYTPSSQGSRSATIALSATGPCGPYSVNFTSTSVNYYSSPFSISPNPSTEIVTVNMDNDNLSDNPSQNLIYGITITDLYGIPVESFEYKAGISSVNISVKDFKTGLYILSVFDGKIWTSQRLIIQK
jgi:hypothetical protein